MIFKPLITEWFFYAMLSGLRQINRQASLKLNEYEIRNNKPHCFAYKTKELLIELLGGVRIDGLLYILAPGHLSTVIA